MSNDHDGVSEDGQEPVDATPSDEASELSAPKASAEVAGDSSDKPRSVPEADQPADPIGVDIDAAGNDASDNDAADSSSAASSSAGSSGADAAALATPGPVSAGSARAAARRTAARAGISEGKGVATPKRAAATTVKKPNVFARLGRFLREVVAELRKVIWPTKNQMVTYTIVVIVFVTFMVALVGVLDLLFAKGVLAVFG